MPVVSLVAFEERTGGFIFLRVPTEFGRYVRSHVSVAYVACPRCNSTVGEPCKFDGKYQGSTHGVRRDEFKRGRHTSGDRPRVDVTSPDDGAHVTVK